MESISGADRFNINKRFKIKTSEFNCNYVLMDSDNGAVLSKEFWSFGDVVREQRILETSLVGMWSWKAH